MTDEEDIDGLAAEYVLGSLTPQERQEVDARRKTDRALSDAVSAWERRLGTLSHAVPGVAPPPHLYSRIAQSLWGHGQQTVQFRELSALRRGTRRWRTAGLVAGALAACLAMVVVWLLQHGGPGPTARATALVAVLQREANVTTADEPARLPSQPAFVINVDLKARSIVVSPVTARPVARRSYQLWLMQPGVAPSSLGIVSPSEATMLPWRARPSSDDYVGATLAISLEPEGGSLTAAPSGPIAFVGRLVQP